MSKKYHINESGEARECQAGEDPLLRGCPFGGTGKHFDTAADARKAYEIKMAREDWNSFKDESSEWRSLPFEARQKLLEDQTQSLAKLYGIIPPPPRIDISWSEGKDFRLTLGASYDHELNRKNKKEITYYLRLEELEKLTCQEVMCHELGHLLRWSAKDHSSDWSYAAKTIGSTIPGLKDSDFPPQTKLSAQEHVRVEARFFRVFHPEQTAKCSSGHYVYSFEGGQRPPWCDVCFAETGEDAEFLSWERYSEPIHEKVWIQTSLRELSDEK